MTMRYLAAALIAVAPVSVLAQQTTCTGTYGSGLATMNCYTTPPLIIPNAPIDYSLRPLTPTFDELDAMLEASRKRMGIQEWHPNYDDWMYWQVNRPLTEAELDRRAGEEEQRMREQGLMRDPINKGEWIAIPRYQHR